ncbi:MAG TPA: hypothetical protein VGC54_03660 [Planctomycetota bacterium]
MLVPARNSLLAPLGIAVALTMVAVLAAVPAPRSSAEQHKIEQLRDRLEFLRNATFRFRMDHFDDHGSLPLGLSGHDPEQQLLGRTGLDGAPLTVAPGDRRGLGPYLDKLPVNPFNGLSSIRSLPGDQKTADFQGSHGWVYLPATARVHPDLPGFDAFGRPFSDY